MTFSLKKLEEIALCLENDGAFHRRYIKTLTLGDRRSVIQSFLGYPSAYNNTHQPQWWGKNTIEDREQLRRYFDERYELQALSTDQTLHKYDYLPNIWKAPPLPAAPDPSDMAGFPAYVPPCPYTHPALTPAKDTDMTTTKTPIQITTKTFANGEDISTMADSAIYDLIARQEADIKELEKIEAKPKKLVAEIAKRKEGIAALVAYLDSKEA